MEFGMEVLVQTAIQKPRNFDMRISSQQQQKDLYSFTAPRILLQQYFDTVLTGLSVTHTLTDSVLPFQLRDFNCSNIIHYSGLRFSSPPYKFAGTVAKQSIQRHNALFITWNQWAYVYYTADWHSSNFDQLLLDVQHGIAPLRELVLKSRYRCTNNKRFNRRLIGG